MSTNVILDPERVNAIFMDCMFASDEDTSGYIEADGISCKVAFHPKRIENHREEIISMLNELPNEFNESGGGGMSFVMACYDKHGNLWTGLHTRMDQLFMLGIGIGRVKCPMPRAMWSVLPGGMPYYIITNEADTQK